MIKAAVTIGMSLFLGLVFFGAGDMMKEDYMSLSHVAGLQMIVLCQVMACSQAQIISFALERRVFVREYASGFYGCIPYSLSKLLLSLPFCFITSLVSWLCIYWMFHANGPFFLLVLVSFLLCVGAQCAAEFLGACARDVRNAAELHILLTIPPIVLSGIISPVTDIPWPLRWLHWCFLQTYAFYDLILAEFFYHPEKADCLELVAPIFQDAIDETNVKRHTFAQNIIILIGWIIGLRILFTIVLHFRGVLANV